MGVGNEMMGDDAAGSLAARELLRKLKIQDSKFKISIIETGTTPENFTGQIQRFGPDLVLVIDAADMEKPVGEIAFLDPAAMHSMMHSTHTMPLSFLAGYIGKVTGAKVIALGIQAGQINLDVPMNRTVAESVKQLVQFLISRLCPER